MKIAIMTWSKHKGYLNYGTSLQVCALSYYLKTLGHSCKIIDYEPRKYNKFNGKLVQNIKYKISSFFHKTNMSNFERSELFSVFFRNNLDFTKKCDTLPELEELNVLFDCFVCGSDQIWALFDPHYYLDFVRDDSKKVAYAPSIALADLKDEAQKQHVKRLASSFKRLSTREKIGSDFLSNLTGKTVETVLDPTLLLTSSDWEKVCNVTKTNDNNYILVYFLGHSQKYWKTVRRISKQLKMPIRIIPVFMKDYERSGCLNAPIGPSEFVSLVSNSSLVLTDSFHGVLFSINFKKPFFVFERFKGSDSYQNNRIYEILFNLGLMDRLINRKHCDFDQPIDFELVSSKLSRLREKSARFLEECLLEAGKNSQSILRRNGNDVKSQHSICCGCGACVEVCPQKALRMIQTSEGFWESSIDYGKCINCGRCLKICPLHESRGVRYEDSKIYSFKIADSDVLQRSSSGGAAYALETLLLEKKYSVVGCTYSKAKNAAEHIVLDSNNNLADIQGSKYLQSDFAGVFIHLKGKEKVAFFGTPCQIAGAKRLFGDEMLYVDLICHGVPSSNLFRKYLQLLKKKYDLDTSNLSVVFRDKTKGWRDLYIRLDDGNKALSINQHKDLFYLMFEHSLCYGNQCYECPWRDKSEADIRVGDFWDEQYKGDKTGVSIVFVFSNKGKELVGSLNDYGEIVEKRNVNFRKFQQTKNIIKPVERETIIDLLSGNAMDLDSIVKKYVKPKEKRRIIEHIGLRLKRRLRVIRYGKGKV